MIAIKEYDLSTGHIETIQSFINDPKEWVLQILVERFASEDTSSDHVYYYSKEATDGEKDI